MKIGVISDTHLNCSDRRLEEIVENHLKDVDVILHAGDLVCLDVLSVFKGKDIYAVSGNMDYPEVREVFPGKRIVELGGHRIGLIHGWGAPQGIERKIRAEFDDDISCLVYGHTHRAANEVMDDVLYFNPGSPTDRRFSPFTSVGILEVGEMIRGRIIKLK